jgi:hypothetical protein
MPNETGLADHKIATIDRASRWVVMSGTQPDMLRSFIVSSLSDLQLATKVSQLNAAQLSALLRELRSRRDTG